MEIGLERLILDSVQKEEDVSNPVTFDERCLASTTWPILMNFIPKVAG